MEAWRGMWVVLLVWKGGVQTVICNSCINRNVWIVHMTCHTSTFSAGGSVSESRALPKLSWLPDISIDKLIVTRCPMLSCFNMYILHNKGTKEMLYVYSVLYDFNTFGKSILVYLLWYIVYWHIIHSARGNYFLWYFNSYENAVI